MPAGVSHILRSEAIEQACRSQGIIALMHLAGHDTRASCVNCISTVKSIRRDYRRIEATHVIT